MPAHDWMRVRAGIFHDFHNAWITQIRNALNGGILPPDYYALGERSAGAAGAGDEWGSIAHADASDSPYE